MKKQHSSLKNWIPILGMAALIVVLVIAAQMVFEGLGAMIPRREPGPFTALSNESGGPSPYGMRQLEEEERQAADIEGWLDRAREWTARNDAAKEHSVFWLYRQSTDEYVLYLPGQDRRLSAADVTASEEVDDDGVIGLTLRIRTPEGGEGAAAEEQLLTFNTQTEQWKGIRVKVILDGRERDVYKLTSEGSQLYSTDEVYIGRDR